MDGYPCVSHSPARRIADEMAHANWNLLLLHAKATFSSTLNQQDF